MSLHRESFPRESFPREHNGPAPLEALFRAESSRLDFGEDEDDHSAFVMSLSRLAKNLASYADAPQGVNTPVRP